MNRNQLLLAAAAVLTASMLIRKRRRTKYKKDWVKPWIMRRQSGRGILNMLDTELISEEPHLYKKNLRMSSQQFDNLLNLIAKDISKTDTVMRDCIPAKNKLEVTLRFLASGESYRSLMYSTRIHESTISRFVPEVCQAIYNNLKDPYLKVPTTEVAWKAIAKEFNDLWQFPNCLGALDGRHIKFKPPRYEGAYYYNYKGDHSIVLLGLADATYKFTYVNVGVNGRNSDGGVFRESTLSGAIASNTLNFPISTELPNETCKAPYVIVADDAFPLTNVIMKPYSQRGLTHECKIFNYRLSRARRIIESTFGILANRFRILLNAINLNVEKVEIITLACVTLHNYLASVNYVQYISQEPQIETHLEQRRWLIGNRSSNEAQSIRDKFKNYFCSPEGSVPWQEDAVARNNM